MIRHRRCRGERGQAAGLESLPFGILVFVSGTLLMVNLWATIDARTRLDGAGREYLRAYTAQLDRSSAELAGHAALERSLQGGFPEVRVVAPSGPFGPCRPATVRVEVEVDGIRIPFVGAIGSRTVSTTQTELIQPFLGAIDEAPGTGSVCDG